MRNLRWILLLVLVPVFPIGAEPPQQEKGMDLSWAFPVTDKDLPPSEDTGMAKQVPDSDKSYTQAQIDNLSNPPDWFPDEHAPMPKVVQHGGGAEVPGCASCHLASGLGHPESANLAGLSAEYTMRQLSYFKSGARKDPPRDRMAEIAKGLSEDDAQEASNWFATLKPGVWEKVVETVTVPKTYVDKGHMRFARPGAGTEPIGNRIIELPQDPARVERRDPHSGFVAYVPVGSIAKGKKLVTTGNAGKAIPCSICHGQSLNGLGGVPGIAGRSPLYIVRQLYYFQTGARASGMAELMKGVVAQLDQADMVAIAAYVASCKPNNEQLTIGTSSDQRLADLSKKTNHPE